MGVSTAIKLLPGMHTLSHLLYLVVCCTRYNVCIPAFGCVVCVSVYVGGTEHLSCCMEQKSMISEWTCGIIYNYEIEIGRVINFALVIFQGCWLYIW